MSLLTQASLVLTPNAVKTSKLYSIIPSNGNGDMTVVRATPTATRVNSLGLIESVAANVARLNYDSIGGCPSILVEPQRTNLNLYSEDFGNAYWSLFQSTRSVDVVLSPSGIQNADKIIENSTSNPHSIFINTAFSVTIGQTYTRSVYAKADGRNWISLVISDGTQFRAFFDLQNNVIGNITAGITALIENAGNGWYRCSITRTTTTSSISSMAIELASSNGVNTYLGNGTSGVYLWGAQLELGAYQTSYIPTTTVTISRNADIITRNNIYTNNLITSLGGTLFLELNNNLSLTRSIAGNGIWIGDNNTSSTAGNSLNIRHNGGTARLGINKTISGILTTLYTTLTNTVKIAIDWNGTTADVFVNGVKVVTGTSFTTTNMEFLNTDGLGDVHKYIKSMILFPKTLTDAELISLTTL